MSHKYDLKGHVTGLYKPVGGAQDKLLYKFKHVTNNIEMKLCRHLD